MRKVDDDNRIPQFKASLPKAINRALEDLGDATRDQIDDGFASGTDAMGNEWLPLSQKTIAEKGHDRILIETSALRNSFDHSVDSVSHTLTVENDNWKGSIHEFGAPDQNIPPRPFMVPAARWVEEQGIDDHFEPTLNTVTGMTLLNVRGV